MGLGQRGVWDLPLVVVLSLFLASGIFIAGFRGLQGLQHARERSEALRDFHEFRLALDGLALGIAGSSTRIQLESRALITVEGRTARLNFDGENLSVQELPLPARTSLVLHPGDYLVELVRENGGLYFDFRRV